MRVVVVPVWVVVVGVKACSVGCGGGVGGGCVFLVHPVQGCGGG